MDKINIASINLLHWEFDNSSITPEVPEHTHGYWQLELCVKGKIYFHAGELTRTITAGEGVCLPPGVVHGFHNDGSYYSFKFHMETSGSSIEEPIFFSANSLTSWALENFAMRRKTVGILLEIGNERAILEAILFALFRNAISGKKNLYSEPKLATHLRHWVANTHRQPTVSDAAEYCKMSVSQLKYRFACEVASMCPDVQAYSVKSFIDKAVMELIDRYLEFTDLPLGAISERLGFNNVYTFSRFCRRMTGMPPGKRRSCKKR